jgi:hypothetical protein
MGSAMGEAWAIVTLIQVSAVCVGWFMILKCAFILKDYGLHGDYAQHSPWQVLMAAGVGVLLINSHQVITDFSDTILGADISTFANGHNPLGYSIGKISSDLYSKWQKVLSAITAFFMVVGYFAFTKGLVIWHKTSLGDQQANFWKGFYHCAGGWLAINFTIVSQILVDTLAVFNVLSK